MRDIFLEQIKKRHSSSEIVFWKKLSLILFEVIVSFLFSWRYLDLLILNQSISLASWIEFFLLLFFTQFFVVLNAIIFKNVLSLLELNLFLSFVFFLPSFIFEGGGLVVSWQRYSFFFLFFAFLTFSNILVRKANNNLIKFQWGYLVGKGKFFLNLALISFFLFPFLFLNTLDWSRVVNWGISSSLKGCSEAVKMVYPWFDWQMSLEDFSENIYDNKVAGAILSQKISQYLEKEISEKEEIGEIARLYLEKNLPSLLKNKLVKFVLLAVFLLVVLPVLSFFSLFVSLFGRILIFLLVAVKFFHYSSRDVYKEELVL